MDLDDGRPIQSLIERTLMMVALFKVSEKPNLTLKLTKCKLKQKGNLNYSETNSNHYNGFMENEMEF